MSETEHSGEKRSTLKFVKLTASKSDLALLGQLIGNCAKIAMNCVKLSPISKALIFDLFTHDCKTTASMQHSAQVGTGEAQHDQAEGDEQ